MNLTVRRLDRFSQVEEIYASRMPQDFDPDEIRPLFSLRKSWERKEYICYGLSGSAGLVAYAFFVHRGRHLLLDYLAVSETHRGEGLGSAFLKEVTARIPDAECVLVEVEDPDGAQDEEARSLRLRRIAFYRRSGFYDTGIRSCSFGVDFCILNADSENRLPQAELRDFYCAMYRSILPRRIFEANFRIKDPCR
jgi:GNAT superfamily N-acetyltransferase